MAATSLAIPVEVRDYLEHKDWKKLNPNGTVPIWVESDLILSESNVILEYLIDQQPTLLPGSAVERARARSIWAYFDSQVGINVRKVVFEKRGKLPKEWDGDLICSARNSYCDALGEFERDLEKPAISKLMHSGTVPQFVALTRIALGRAYALPIPESCVKIAAWFQASVRQPFFKSTAPESVAVTLHGH